MTLLAQFTSEQTAGALIAILAMLYIGVGVVVIHLSGDGFLSIQRGRTLIFIVLLEYAMALVTLVVFGSLIALGTDSIALTLVAAYTYLVFVVIRLWDPFKRKVAALKAPVSSLDRPDPPKP